MLMGCTYIQAYIQQYISTHIHTIYTIPTTCTPHSTTTTQHSISTQHHNHTHLEHQMSNNDPINQPYTSPQQTLEHMHHICLHMQLCVDTLYTTKVGVTHVYGVGNREVIGDARLCVCLVCVWCVFGVYLVCIWCVFGVYLVCLGYPCTLTHPHLRPTFHTSSFPHAAAAAL